MSSPNSRPITVALLETAPTDAAGSMPRFAALLIEAFQGDPGFRLVRVPLAPTAEQLRARAPRWRNLAHHGTIAGRMWGLTRRHPADLYHLLDGSHGYVAFGLPATRTVATAHDVIPLLQSLGKFPISPPGRGARWLIQRGLAGLRRCRRVMTDSARTADDLVTYGQLDRSRLDVVHLALEPNLAPAGVHELPTIAARRRRETPFVFHIGNNGFYKNRLGVLRVFAHVRATANVRLRLAGPPLTDEMQRFIVELGLAPHVDVVVNPTDDVVREAYRTAQLLLFPSIYEGFGWPPLEAMAWGCPVVCTTAGSLGEIVGPAALVGHHEDEVGLAELVCRVLNDDALATDLADRGRAWVERYQLSGLHDRVARVYRELAETPA